MTTSQPAPTQPTTTHRSAPRYYALSTLGGDWSVEIEGAPGEPKAAVEERAMRAICGSQWDQPKDLVTDTRLKNLVVVSKSQAQRRFPSAMFYWEHQYPSDPAWEAAHELPC